MSGFDFDTPVDRHGTSASKWERYRGRDVIPMWVADMDFRAPEAIVRAIGDRLAHGVFGYSDVPPSLVEAVTGALQRDHGWDVDPDWLVWLPGLVPGLHLGCTAATEPGDAVLTAIPVYPPFMAAPRRTGRTLSTVALVEDGGRYGWDYAALEAAIGPRTRLLMLCNPHNPVGRVFRTDELDRLLAICERHDLAILSDEIHAGLVLDEASRHVPVATRSRDAAARTITLMAPSKTFNIPGLGVSFAVIPDARLRRRFEAGRRGLVPDVNVLGYAAATAAYRDCADWHAALIGYLRGNLALLRERVASWPGFRLTPTEGTYLAWIDVRGSGIRNPVGFFEAAGVGLYGGEYYGAAGWIRLNFGCPRVVLAEALDRMERALRAR